MQLAIEYEQEDDGRWIAQIEAIPGALAYGTTREEARRRVKAIALVSLANVDPANIQFSEAETDRREAELHAALDRALNGKRAAPDVFQRLRKKVGT